MQTNKLEKLKSIISELEKDSKKIAIAYSSGVDSTFLLKVAKDVLNDKVIAISAGSYIFAKRELEEAKDFCKKENIEHHIFNFEPLKIEGYSQNPKNRCYICKLQLFKQIIEIAQKNNANIILEGSNTDDLSDFRPGLKAIEELKIKSPLKEAQLTKNEIRNYSKLLGLHSCDKATFACFASRFEYEQEITKEKIKMVDSAEEFLFVSGFKQFRVRMHNNLARIEVMPNEFEKLIQYRKPILDEFSKIGFKYVSLDLKGYRTGSMNEVLTDY